MKLLKGYGQKTMFAVSALAMMTVTTVSTAGPIVTDWNYSTNATFTDATFTAGTGTTNGGTGLPGLDYELSWGGNGGFQGDGTINRSALTIGTVGNIPGGDSTTGGGPATGSVETLVGGGLPGSANIGSGVSLTHWNNPIDASYATLLTGTIVDTLTLWATAPNPPYDGSVPVEAPEITFNFNFAETPNAGPCAAGTPEPCGDLFGIFGTPTLNQAFTYNDVNYLASVVITDGQGGAAPIATLADAQCSAMGLPNGCQGFLTTESAATTVSFGFVISTEPVFVPEPATLALMGLGLMGIGGYRRFRKA